MAAFEVQTGNGAAAALIFAVKDAQDIDVQTLQALRTELCALVL